MRFWEIFRFEFGYQIRGVLPWLYFGILTIVAYAFVTENGVYDARSLDGTVNAPFMIANIMVFCSLLWLLAGGAVAGAAGARDVQTRMFPLTYTLPVSKTTYLAGRFLAAFSLNALILLAVPTGILLALYTGDIEPEILGPFRASSYITAYAYIALPNAFVATAIQFTCAALTRLPVASYIGSMVLWVSAYIAGPLVYSISPYLGTLVDPVFVIGIGEWADLLTPIEQDTRMIAFEGALLMNRMIWIGAALGLLTFTGLRFRRAQPAVGFWGRRQWSRESSQDPSETGIFTGHTSAAPAIEISQNFRLTSRLSQTAAIAKASFFSLAKSPAGLFALILIAAFVVLIVPLNLSHMGIPLTPRTGYLLTYLTSPLASPTNRAWMVIPLLIVFYAGELVWREREAGLGDMVGAAPVPEWVSFLGKFLGLSLLLIVWQALLSAAGMLAQGVMGYTNFEPGLYLKVMFGLQLVDYLLFALLALVIHVVVNHKQLGYLVALIVYGYIAFAPLVGIELKMLVYGSDPGWSYSDIRGFGPHLAPWFWYKLYWVAWAMVLAVIARLAWVRGRDTGFSERLKTAWRRFDSRTAAIAGASAVLVAITGGFIAYNTHVLNQYRTSSDVISERAEYERLYAEYQNIPQPRLTRVDLRVELYPDARTADIRGSYQLLNAENAPMEVLHISFPPNGDLKTVSFGRPVTPKVTDDRLRQHIYTLDQPLQPGETLQMDFELRSESRGFANGGADSQIVPNGSYIKDTGWMPALGYQLERELTNPADRRAHGLVERAQVPALDDARALAKKSGQITFEAVVGTKEGQTAIAPGELRQTWTDSGRSYFHYATNAPINNRGYSIFSADYAVKEVVWKDVTIQIFHHRGHDKSLDRIAASALASLDHFTKVFGPYPHRTLRFIENPASGMGAHADATTVDYGENFSLFDPGDGPQDVDFVFAVAAHEMAHQWWGNQLIPARVEGAPLISETLAWYSAMQVVEQTYGPEHMKRLLDIMRVVYESPRSRASVPLLRAAEWFQGYRKGPFAMHAMREYIGRERVDQALRKFLEKHGPGTFPLATSLDLYRELQAVTPPEYQYLLQDLFEANTFWDLDTKAVTAEKIGDGLWQVTLEVEAGKAAVDSEGNETLAAMDDWIEIGVFAPAGENEKLGKPIYLEKHRIHTGRQTITIKVPAEPANAGIDPNYLLVDMNTVDNIRSVKMGVSE